MLRRHPFDLRRTCARALLVLGVTWLASACSGHSEGLFGHSASDADTTPPSEAVDHAPAAAATPGSVAATSGSADATRGSADTEPPGADTTPQAKPTGDPQKPTDASEGILGYLTDPSTLVLAHGDSGELRVIGAAGAIASTSGSFAGVVVALAQSAVQTEYQFGSVPKITLALTVAAVAHVAADGSFTLTANATGNLPVVVFLPQSAAAPAIGKVSNYVATATDAHVTAAYKDPSVDAPFAPILQLAPN